MLFQKSEMLAGTLPGRIEPLVDFLNHERIPTGEKSPPKLAPTGVTQEWQLLLEKRSLSFNSIH